MVQSSGGVITGRDSSIPAGFVGSNGDRSRGQCGYALRKDGTVIGWGGNHTRFCRVPQGLQDVVAVSAGDYITLDLKKDGTVVSWGEKVIPDRNG
jgi:alpha-tubulin suppressor-like RCC1 family protein